MRKLYTRALKWTSTAAMGVAAFTFLGTICRTWLYEPPIRARLYEDAAE